MVDLWERHHQDGRRFEPTELVESGARVAVGLRLTDERWHGESVEIFKVFTFREPDAQIVLLQDCVDREDALAQLS